MTNNVYEAHGEGHGDDLAEGQEPPAETSTLDVEVTVKDVDEPGTITLDRLQPQAGAVLTASFTDPDQGQVPGRP